MNEALPAAATTSGRFLIAGLALSPFLPRLPRSLLVPAQLGPRAAPQVWLGGVLTLAGVGLLELGSEGVHIGAGDAWAVLQAVGFGSAFYVTERMMRLEPEMALPITAVQCATVAAFSAAWALCDGYGLGPFASVASAGWMMDEAIRAKATLPGLILQGGPIAMAALWTGLVTTAANRIGETSALGKVGADEASVLVATEPLWAAAFGCLVLGEVMDAHEYVGGALVVAACLVSTRSPEQVRAWLTLGKSGVGSDRAPPPGSGGAAADGTRSSH